MARRWCPWCASLSHRIGAPGRLTPTPPTRSTPLGWAGWIRLGPFDVERMGEALRGPQHEVVNLYDTDGSEESGWETSEGEVSDDGNVGGHHHRSRDHLTRAEQARRRRG